MTTTTTTTTTTRTTTTTTPYPIPTTTASPTKIMGPLCQGQYTYVQCDPGKTLNVMNVFNGRVDQSACRAAGAIVPYAASIPCSSTIAYSYVSSQCQGQAGCW
jgi:hypothetical protein